VTIVTIVSKLKVEKAFVAIRRILPHAHPSAILDVVIQVACRDQNVTSGLISVHKMVAAQAIVFVGEIQSSVYNMQTATVAMRTKYAQMESVNHLSKKDPGLLL